MISFYLAINLAPNLLPKVGYLLGKCIGIGPFRVSDPFTKFLNGDNYFHTKFGALVVRRTERQNCLSNLCKHASSSLSGD